MTTKQQIDRLAVIVPIVNELKHVECVAHLVADYKLEISVLKQELHKTIQMRKVFKTNL